MRHCCRRPRRPSPPGKGQSFRQGGWRGERAATFRRQCQAAPGLCAVSKLYLLIFPKFFRGFWPHCCCDPTLPRAFVWRSASAVTSILGVLSGRVAVGGGGQFPDCGGFKKVTGVQSRHPKSCAEGSWRRGGAAAIACLALGVVFCARPAVAETLVEALSNAYLINPVLNAERANLRATDEQVAVAKSGLRPNISASGDAAFQNQESDIVGGSRSQSSNVLKCDAATAALEPAFCAFLASQSQTNVGNIESQLSSDGVTHPRGYSVTLSQTVFAGFQNINAIRQAKATVQAGREGLRATEQTTLLNAATAYVDVVRDQAVVRLRQTNVDVLTEQLRQTK